MNAEVCLSCERLERHLGEEEERVHVLRGVSLDIEAGSVHAFFLFAQVALDSFATEANFCAHREPRMVTTGGNSAARRAGT